MKDFRSVRRPLRATLLKIPGMGGLKPPVLAGNAKSVAEFRAGKEKAFNSLVGKTMAASKRKANPARGNAILKRKLGS